MGLDDRVLKVDLSQIGWGTWISLWWGHFWRTAWRMMLWGMVIAAPIIMIFGRSKIGHIDFADVIMLPISIVLAVLCGARALDAMMTSGEFFGGYKIYLKAEQCTEDVRTRKGALREISLGLNWRFWLVLIPYEIMSGFLLAQLHAADATAKTLVSSSLMFDALRIILMAILWRYFIQQLLGRKYGRYRFGLTDGMTPLDAERSPIQKASGYADLDQE